jgi:hypothetical protein
MLLAFQGLGVALQLNPFSFSSRPTVGAVTWCPCRDSSAARCRNDFVVQRNGDIGSPRSSGSTRPSSAGTRDGSTASARIRPPPGVPNSPLGERLSTVFEFEYAPADGGLADLGSPRDPAHSTMTEQPGLGRHRQAPLTLVQVRQQDLEALSELQEGFLGYAHTTSTTQFPGSNVLFPYGFT